jgi:tripartite-type tricarboxylate transporter receptor subunit TctC
LRALGVSSLQRAGGMPDVPTIAEMGYPGFSASGLAGLVAPAGTPTEAIQRLHAAVVKLLKLPPVQDRFLTLGMDAVGNTPAEFGEFIKADMDKWSRLIKELNLTSQ